MKFLEEILKRSGRRSRGLRRSERRRKGRELLGRGRVLYSVTSESSGLGLSAMPVVVGPGEVYSVQGVPT